jgi:hypothetical protein
MLISTVSFYRQLYSAMKQWPSGKSSGTGNVRVFTTFRNFLVATRTVTAYSVNALRAKFTSTQVVRSTSTRLIVRFGRGVDKFYNVINDFRPRTMNKIIRSRRNLNFITSAVRVQSNSFYARAPTYVKHEVRLL